MSTRVDVHDPAFSLVRGGPLYALWRRCGLAPHGHPDPLRLAAVSIAVLWLPLVAMAVLEGMVTGRLPPILDDVSMHVRLLVTVPMSMLSEAAVDRFTRRAAEHLRGVPIVTDAGVLTRIWTQASRLRDAWIAELALFVLGLGLSIGAMWGIGPWQGSAAMPTAGNGPAALWFTLVALPVSHLLALRWLWRWAIWLTVFVRLVCAPIRIESSHPDRRGGLGVIADSMVAFAPAACGVVCMVAGAWAARLARGLTRLVDLRIEAALLVGAVMLVLLGPLLVFTPSLRNAYLEGRREFGRVTSAAIQEFRTHWIEGASAKDLLEHGPIENMASLGEIYDRVLAMRLVPVSRATVIQCLCWGAGPLAPLVLFEIPLAQLLHRLSQILVGRA